MSAPLLKIGITNFRKEKKRIKKEEKKLNLKEAEAKKEHTPEEQGCVRLTDEQMAQVTGGAGSEFEYEFEEGEPPRWPKKD